MELIISISPTYLFLRMYHQIGKEHIVEMVQSLSNKIWDLSVLVSLVEILGIGSTASTDTL